MRASVLGLAALLVILALASGCERLSWEKTPEGVYLPVYERPFPLGQPSIDLDVTLTSGTATVGPTVSIRFVLNRKSETTSDNLNTAGGLVLKGLQAAGGVAGGKP